MTGWEGKSTAGELIAVILCMTGIASAQEREAVDIPIPEEPYRLTFHFENDGSFAKPNHNTDRHYTNGVKITFSYRPEWADDFADWLNLRPDENGDIKTAGGFAIGQNIYTPDRIENPALRNPEDRQFAGWLYLSTFWQHEANNELDHVELNFGVVGEASLAEKTQKFIHEAFDGDDPIGWDNQFGDSFGINLMVQHKWKIDLPIFRDPIQLELIPQGGFTLGSLNRHVNFGATFRLGINLPLDYGPARIEEPAAATNLQAKSEPGWYVFARFGMKFVAYNRFLSGVDLEPILGEAQFGVVFQWEKISFGYSQTYMSQEFETQGGKDSFGALVLSFSHNF